jgi:hypothetical protein
MRCMKIFMILWAVIVGASVMRGVTFALTHAVGTSHSTSDMGQPVQLPAR